MPNLPAMDANRATASQLPDSGFFSSQTTRYQNSSQVPSSNSQDSQSNGGSSHTQSTIPKPPALSLPKGGGAIRGMGEKFDVAAATGVGSATIPIRVSPGRSDFDPKMKLQYSSNGGNGPFGLGWHLDIPEITRKTEKGLPRYMDAGPEAEADVFLLAGAEDLVPVFQRDSQGSIALDRSGAPIVKDTTLGKYKVRRFQPRTEGSFSRIERWTNTADSGDVYWRVITGTNVTSIYGKDDNSRVFGPVAPAGSAKCIFSWLLSESFDPHGNAMVFRYKAEDSNNVDLFQAHETNRSASSRTAHRYLKTIQYGNQIANRELSTWHPTLATALADSGWHFTVVFDYGEHDAQTPTLIETQPWTCRSDPFSSYKPGFEDRVYRLCRRILMFHQFPELGNAAQLVSSTDLEYDENPYATKLTTCTAAGYSRSTGSELSYTRRSLPPLQYEYTEFPPDDVLAARVVQDIDTSYLENVPAGVDGSAYQWVDLYAEGLPGIFSEQADGWYFKRNSSTNNTVRVSDSIQGTTQQETIRPRLEPLSLLTSRPSLSVAGGEAHFGDVDGSGRLDVIEMQPHGWGYFEQADDEGWTDFRYFQSIPNIRSEDAKLVDLTGDGLADLLIAEDRVYTWSQSLGVEGFGEPIAITQANEESSGPVSFYSDTEEYIVLADFSGDGLSDIARIRNGDICYWPNLGYGRFGSMIRMDNAPYFEPIDLFQTKRVHLADIDGSGTTDLIYVHANGVDIYLNCAGNGFSSRKRIELFPEEHTLSRVNTIDLLGNGTTCLVWSTWAPQDVPIVRYLDITGGVKANLLKKFKNNFGLETMIQYAPSTKFYLQDMADGRPWLTRLPFPVYCVERVDTHDRITGSHFVNKYRYHDGFYDGLEREFRGFAMVEQWDTDEFSDTSKFDSSNVDMSWHVPPIHTKTWYHTGVYIDNSTITTQWAQHYFGGTPDTPSNLLDDTILPAVPLLGGNELREACRALKGRMLRVEVYADDNTPSAQIPYSFKESNYTVEVLQPVQDANLHSIYFVHPREVIDVSCDRVPDDPRIHHEMTLEVDAYGNLLKSIEIAYGRRPGKSDLQGLDRVKQETMLFVYTEHDVTNLIDSDSDYRLPVVSEARVYQLSGLQPGRGTQFRFCDLAAPGFSTITSLPDIPFEQPNVSSSKQKRMITQSRTLYRKDDLSGLLQVGEIGALALPGCEYQRCFTPGLLNIVFQRQLPNQALENLIPNPLGLLSGTGEQQAGYVDLNGDGNWWKPSGRAFYHPDINASASQELALARQHFFSIRRLADPFGNASLVTFDGYDLFPVSTQDPMENVMSVEMDYRVLSPAIVTDFNGNRSAAAFDALGLLAGTAVMGQPSENLGDSLTGFQADLTPDQVNQFFNTPRGTGSISAGLLANATTRIIYDPNRYFTNQTSPLPVYTATVSRETHVSDLPAGTSSKLQLSFAYTDGRGRVIQSKNQDKPGPLSDGGVVVSNRWVGSGWTIDDNKGQPVRTYEPFFDDTHDFDLRINGVSTIAFYDPLSRVVATLHPDKTLNKVRFTSWTQTTFDGNDNVLVATPKADPDIGSYFAHLPDYESTPSWYNARIADNSNPNEQSAAEKTALHANTPTVTYLDVLGRPILTIRDNGSGGKLTSRSNFDILGNQSEVYDSAGRLVMSYDFDMTSTHIHQTSVDSGERWLLNDVGGQPMLAWNSRGFRQRSVFDANRRQIASYSRDDSKAGDVEIQVAQFIFGEAAPSPSAHNLLGKAYITRDQGGTATMPDYDFKGNLLRSERRFARTYTSSLDWSGNVDLEGGTFVATTSYDALNRIVTAATPDGSVASKAYNESGRLELLRMNIRGDESSTNPATWTAVITGSDYNARGQIALQNHGNGAQTVRTYDENTFRLRRVLTTLPGTSGTKVLQDLNYVYDPVGNITSVRDNAFQPTFFRNNVVNASNSYTYDPVYRLINATGREHLGQGGADNPASQYDETSTGLPQPGDGNAMANYTETYSYDATDNMIKLAHGSSDAAKPGWTRTLAYDSTNNQLVSTSIGFSSEGYAYDANGNMTTLGSSTTLSWNFVDQLQSSSHQILNNGTPETTYYVYDSTGQRIRKVTERAASAGQEPRKLKERLYVGVCEVYRTYAGDGVTKTLERETLNISGEGGTAARVETRTFGDDHSVGQQIRYQFSNSVDSVMLELGADGGVVSYEEYTPYGSTSYQAVASQLDAPKRYRYSGKERDEESGLYYFGSRYYAPWICRWISPDAIGIADGLNIYQYASSNPIKLADHTGHAGADDTLPSPPPDPKPLPSAIDAAYQEAEKAGYDDASVSKLIDLTESERKTAHEGIATRKAALSIGAIRASAAVVNWEQGNYVRAIYHGTLGVADSLGVGMFLGDSNLGTAVKTGAALLAGTAFSKLGKILSRGPKSPTVSIAYLHRSATAVGHVMVGVDAEGGGSATAVWSDLRMGDEVNKVASGVDTGMKTTQAWVAPVARGPNAGYSTLTVPVSTEQAAAASTAAADQIATGMIGQYSYATTHCASYAGDVLGAAGIFTPPVPLTTPAVSYLFVAGQTPTGLAVVGGVSGTVVGTMQLTQGPVPGVPTLTEKEVAAQASLPEEHVGR